VLDDRLDRLYATRAYLQSDASTRSGEAVRQVISEINDRELKAEREKDVHGQTERGLTHG